jgi:hypothetical protein
VNTTKKGRHHHGDENPPDRRPAGVGGRARAAAGEGEGADPRPGRAGGAAPADAVAAGGEGLRVRRAQGPGEPARPVRGPPSAGHLPRLLRAGRGRLARPRVPRLLADGRPGRRPRPPERPGRHVRLRLARPAAGHRPAEEADGLVLALVHHYQRLGRRPRGGRVPRHERVLPRRRPGVPYLLRQQPRRRGARQHLELPGPGSARPPGDLGGLARGLSPDRAVQLVELARRVRPPRDGAGADEGLGDVTF